MTLLIAALVMFVAFHFLNGFDDSSFGPTESGWTIWLELYHVLLHTGDFAEQPKIGIALASFLNFSLLIMASPFLIGVFGRSRLVWWFATASSGIASVGFLVVFAGKSDLHHLAWGGWCLLLAPILNFAGLLLARGKTPPNSGSPAI